MKPEYTLGVELELTPVFSGGVGRSGTTVVGRLLRKHPDLYGGSPNEIQFITEGNGVIDVVFGMRDFVTTQMSTSGRLLAKVPLNKSASFRFRNFRKRVLGDWWSRTNRLGKESGLHRSMDRATMESLLDAFEAELAGDPVVAGRNFIMGFANHHVKYAGQPFWMDTTPANMMYANYLYQLMPNARFIEMRRHPLDTIASVIREPWGPDDPIEAVTWWRDRIALADAALATIPPDQRLTLQLEDLVQRDREVSYQQLLAVVGLSDHPKMRAYFEHEMDADRAHIGRWQDGFEDPDAVLAEYERVVGPLEASA